MLTDEQVAAVRRRASAWVMSPDLDPEWATAWDTAPAIDRAMLLAHIDAQAERIAALEAAGNTLAYFVDCYADNDEDMRVALRAWYAALGSQK